MMKNLGTGKMARAQRGPEVVRCQGEDHYVNWEEFERMLDDLKSPIRHTLNWDKIRSMEDNQLLLRHESINPLKTTEDIRTALAKLVVVKLNGGLGTSMGCVGPKSMIKVRGQDSFLDLIVNQIAAINARYDVDVPLVLMNSFNTVSATRTAIAKMSRPDTVTIHCFNQSMCPRIDASTLEPLPAGGHSLNNGEPWTVSEGTDRLEWLYPPGHGDFYGSFARSGLLDRFLAEGKEVCFLSNVDNLGATVDLGILGHIVGANTADFVMEAAEKTLADVKGGVPIIYDGQPGLVEVAQVPEEHLGEFTAIDRFKHFNTNNLWMKLRSVQRLVSSGSLKLDVISNPKVVQGRKVVQLETAVGSAMKFFDRPSAIVVNRSRFLPVKNCSDLLWVRSDAFRVEEGSLLRIPASSDQNPPEQEPNCPSIHLDPRYYKTLKNYEELIPQTPSLIGLTSLKVSGRVEFGARVSLRKDVIVIAPEDGRLYTVKDGTVLDDEYMAFGPIRSKI